MRGATLLEISVVVAILATLVILVLPAMRSYRSLVQQARCRQNLADIATALRIYAEANGNQDPGSLRNLIPEYLREDRSSVPF